MGRCKEDDVFFLPTYHHLESNLQRLSRDAIEFFPLRSRMISIVNLFSLVSVLSYFSFSLQCYLDYMNSNASPLFSFLCCLIFSQ